MSEIPGQNPEERAGQENPWVAELKPFYSEKGMTERFGDERQRFIRLDTFEAAPRSVYPGGQFENQDGILVPRESVLQLWNMPELAEPKADNETAWRIATHLLGATDGYGDELADVEIGTPRYAEIAEQLKVWAKKWQTSDLLVLEKYNQN